MSLIGLITNKNIFEISIKIFKKKSHKEHIFPPLKRKSSLIT